MNKEEEKNFYINLQVVFGTNDVSNYRIVSSRLKASETGYNYGVMCMCGKDNIENYYWALSKSTNEQFIIGSCCKLRFQIHRSCMRCNKSLTKWVDGYCKKCRIIIKYEEKIRKQELEKIKKMEEIILKQKEKDIELFSQSIIRFGKYRGKKWIDIINSDFKYCEWVYNQDWFKLKNELDELRNREYKKCINHK